jgi:transcriptional regulator with XRE-family HTH domain
VERKPISEIVAASVRGLRSARGETLAQLANRAGIGQRTLGLIESGHGNASMGTLARLADALEVDFADLVQLRTTAAVDVVGPDQARPLWSDADGEGRLLVMASGRGGAELWHWRLEPGGRYDAEADAPGNELLLHVLTGTLTLEVGGEVHTVPAGHSARAATAQPYAYRNAGRGPMEFIASFIPPASLAPYTGRA